MEEQQLSTGTTQSNSASGVWPDWQKQIVGVVLLLLIPVALYFLRPVLPALLLTFAIAFVLMYPIRWLQRISLSYKLAALIVYLLFLLLSMVAIIWFIGYAVGGIIDTLQSSREFVAQIVDRVTGETVAGTGPKEKLDFALNGFKALSVVGMGISLFTSPGDFIAAVIERISRFTSFISGYGFLIILLLFFLLEWPRTLKIIGGRLSGSSRREYAILFRRMIDLGQRYILGSFLIVLFYWLVTTLIFLISGVPNAIVLGLLVAIPNFIPQGGGLVSAIMVFVITLVTGSNTFAVNRLVFAFIEMTIFMLISGVAYYFVDVRIYSKSVNVPVWILLAGMVVFGAVMGVIGVFIAAAAVAILGEVLDFVLKKLQGADPYPGQAEPPLFSSGAGEVEALPEEQGELAQT